MAESNNLRNLLLPELESEFGKTRKLINALPEACVDFKPHEKSFSLASLTGHMTQVPVYIQIILTSPDVDAGALGTKPVVYETRQQLLAEFSELADQAVTALKQTSDETFNQHWKLLWKGHPVFSGARYTAYRDMGLNHLIHHRAQLGVYLRLLNQRVPGTYGPSADEPFGT